MKDFDRVTSCKKTIFSYLSQDKKKKQDGKANVEEEKGKMKALKNKKMKLIILKKK